MHGELRLKLMFKFVYISSLTGLWNSDIHHHTIIWLNKQAFFTNSTTIVSIAFTLCRTITIRVVISDCEHCLSIQHVSEYKGSTGQSRYKYTQAY